MIVAYLFNQYPRTAQAAMRREGSPRTDAMRPSTVERYTVRATDEDLVDPADVLEKSRAKVVLGVGKLGLLRGLASDLVARPRRFPRAAASASPSGWAGGRSGGRSCT